MLADLIKTALRRSGDRPAVADRHGGVGYRALLASAQALADSFAIAPGDGERPRVGIHAANSVAYVEAYLAVLFSGGVPFLIDAAMGAAELTHIVGACGLDALVHDHALPDGVSAAVPPAAAAPWGGMTVSAIPPSPGRPRPAMDPATEICRFTSGSTGHPNCIEFAGTAVAAAAAAWHEGTGLGADDRVVCFAGLSNGLAFNTSLLPVFLAGAALHLAGGLPTASRVAALLTSTRATRLTGFPALYDSLAGRRPSPEGFPDLTLAISSGARLRPETAERLRRVHGITVREYYGVAETGPVTFKHDDRPGLGTALPGASILAGTGPHDTAEIRVRTSSAGTRYLNCPDLFAGRLDAEGYYRTGDHGYLDDGRLILTHRTGRFMNIAGRKVDPVEVRDVICAVDGVSDAMVFSIETEARDEVVVALVAAHGPTGAPDITAACRERLAGYKVPERVKIVDSLPVNTIGKPRAEAARELFA
jgi:acyl-CoA synthetase (AMP-forming)/AMP-acid ligase II